MLPETPVSISSKMMVGSLTARCHLGDRLQLAVFVGTEKEVDFVGSRLVRYFFGSEFHFELDVRDAQRDELFFHLPFHDRGRLLP